MELSPKQTLPLCDCEPFVYLPAWWSSFLFHLLTPRQLSVYTYIAMLGADDGIATPTVRQIQTDMGLASDTVVFEALRALEDTALLRRVRRRNGNGQNAYHRPSCEATIIALLEGRRIDSELRPITETGAETKSDDVAQLAQDGLKKLLGDAYAQYRTAFPSERRDVLLRLLRDSLQRRTREREGAACFCDNIEPLVETAAS